MIELTMDWTKENVWDFVVYNSFIKNSKSKLLITAYVVCLVLIVAAGITAFAIMQDLFVLLMTGIVLLMLIAFWFVFFLTLRTYSKQILEANKSEKASVCRLDDDCISILRDGKIVGFLKWDMIDTADFGKNAAYLMTKESALLIAEYGKITSGTKEELFEMVSRNVVQKA